MKLWGVENGVLRYANGKEIRLGPEMGRLSMAGWWDSEEPYAWEAQTLWDLLALRVVDAGVPRGSGEQDRRDQFVRVSRFPHDQKPGTIRFPRVHQLFDRIGSIVSDIVSLYEVASLKSERADRTPFAEFSHSIQRIGLASELHVESYGPVPSTEKQNGGEEWVDAVKLDGVNVGLASDGTCRVLETLVRLFEPHLTRPGALLLEEPETGIHPALLLRLLHELEAYDGQIIISTHSPQVVSWAKPEDIRLVERKQGKTTVRSLAPAEAERVHEYLAHDGTLGEFVYGGALDDEL